MKEMVLAVVPVGLNREELETVGRALARLEDFIFEVEMASGYSVPDAAFDGLRGQYVADDFLLFDTNMDYDRLLVVTNVDIYSRDLNFVFGIAQLDGKKAVVSIYRLRSKDELFEVRFLKEVMHELGHTLGLAHCVSPRCVMHYSQCLRDTDVKGCDVCPQCSERLQRLPSR